MASGGPLRMGASRCVKRVSMDGLGIVCLLQGFLLASSGLVVVPWLVQGGHLGQGSWLLQTQQQLFAGHVGQALPPADQPAGLQATRQRAQTPLHATVSAATP
jgi:hypothetical protein